MKRVLLNRGILGATALLLVATGGAADFVVRPLTPSTVSAGSTLDGGTIYQVRENITYAPSQAGVSALKVATGTVVIDIGAGCTLTLVGANGSGTTGGGAGLEVTSGATLVVTGEGRLQATGGAAANGSGGGAGGGGEIRFDDDDGRGGIGGTGGAGGGGAGAGIGGAGGTGGGATGGNANSYMECDGDYKGDGKDGNGGKNGGMGGTCGRVFVLGRVAVRVTGGAAGSCGGGGAVGSTKNDKGSGWARKYISGGGGGGGGGGAGGAATGIGGGGAGGGGGGSGGSGGWVHRWNSSSYPSYDASGHGGFGGQSVVKNGSDGSWNSGEGVGSNGRGSGWWDSTDGVWYYGGRGGGGGAAGAEGGAGTFATTADAELGLWPYRMPALLKAGDFASTGLRVKLTLDPGAGARLATGDSGVTWADFGGAMPELRRPVRRGFVFDGWYDARGVCWYDCNLVPTTALAPWTADLALTARWRPGPEALIVNTTADGECLASDKVTLRDALREAAAHAELVSTSGLRRITFDLGGPGTIALTNELVLPAGMAAIEIDGFNQGHGVTLKPAAGVACRHFRTGAESLTLMNLTLREGVVSRASGGSVFVECGGDFYADFCSFVDNRCDAALNGGAIYASMPQSCVVATDCAFAGNAAYNGGAVYLNDSGSLLANCTFSANRAAGRGGAVYNHASVPVGILACTFAGNSAANGKSLHYDAKSGGKIALANCLFADGLRSISGGEEGMTNICSTIDARPADVFTGGGLVHTQVVAGVEQVWYEPRSTAENQDAVLLWYDAEALNLAWQDAAGRHALYGNSDLAVLPLLSDQFGDVRVSTTRGAVRLPVGENDVGVQLEGRYVDKNGEPVANQALTVRSIVDYDDGVAVTNQAQALNTADEGYFAVKIPAEASDGSTHNAVRVRLTRTEDGSEIVDQTVTTVPYALVASSALLLNNPNELDFTGAYMRALEVKTSGVSTTNLLVSGSIVAGGADGFRQIRLSKLKLYGNGRLDWLGAEPRPSTTSFTLKSMQFAGGDDCQTVQKTVNGSISFGDDKAAAFDGFVQLRVEAPAAENRSLRLTVGTREITPAGPFGTSGNKVMIWTVPIAAGEKVGLTMLGFGYTATILRQFIYFGRE